VKKNYARRKGRPLSQVGKEDCVLKGGEENPSSAVGGQQFGVPENVQGVRETTTFFLGVGKNPAMG